MANPRQTYIVANFKMNLLLSESIKFLSILSSQTQNREGIQVIICPPFISLDTLRKTSKSNHIKIGSQNIHHKQSGAFTGEISAAMIQSIGCEYVIVGHSERRKYFQESNTIIHDKLICCFENNLSPILCIGETLDEHENEQTISIIHHQLKQGLLNIPRKLLKHLIIAYEPIWAIGSGKTPKLDEIQTIHQCIRHALTQLHDSNLAESISLLYGGSVNKNNANDIINMPDIDGVLIGKASLDVNTIIHIYHNCH